MNKKLKIWLTLATCFIAVGVIIFIGVMTMLKWDFTKLTTFKYQTNNYQIEENFSDIQINTNTSNIKFVTSENSECTVVCYEQEKLTHSISVSDGTLSIEVVDSRKFFDYIGINFKTPVITIYLPKDNYGALSIKSNTSDVEIPNNFQFQSIDITQRTGNVNNYASTSDYIKIKTTTGDITIENVSANNFELSASTGTINLLNAICSNEFKSTVSTGKTTITNLQCKNFISSGNTGSIYLSSVICTERLFVERSTGSVNFEECDAGEIFIETDTGNVKGSLLSDKVFIVDTDTGRKEVPNTITGGRCEITTDTGDIKINIVNK